MRLGGPGGWLSGRGGWQPGGRRRRRRRIGAKRGESPRPPAPLSLCLSHTRPWARSLPPHLVNNRASKSEGRGRGDPSPPGSSNNHSLSRAAACSLRETKGGGGGGRERSPPASNPPCSRSRQQQPQRHPTIPCTRGEDRQQPTQPQPPGQPQHPPPFLSLCSRDRVREGGGGGWEATRAGITVAPFLLPSPAHPPTIRPFQPDIRPTLPLSQAQIATAAAAARPGGTSPAPAGRSGRARCQRANHWPRARVCVCATERDGGNGGGGGGGGGGAERAARQGFRARVRKQGGGETKGGRQADWGGPRGSRPPGRPCIPRGAPRHAAPSGRLVPPKPQQAPRGQRGGGREQGALRVGRKERWGDRSYLQALVKDAALALQAHVLGPLDEPVQVPLGGQGTADTKGLGPLLKERVGRLLLGLLGGHGGGRRLLSLGSLRKSGRVDCSCRACFRAYGCLRCNNCPVIWSI